MEPLGADAGFLFDIDSDRVALASEDGTPVSEEIVLPMLADYLLPRGTGKLIITNLSTTALLEEVAAKHGGRVLRVPVGRQATMDALATYKADQIALAGEGTGAVMMPQFRFIYDGIASMLAILSLREERGEPLSRIIARYPQYSILKAELPLVPQRMPELMMELQKQYADGITDVRDGLRISWPDRWFHVRVSQTEPVVRVICEQRGEAPVELLEALLDQVRSMA
jgi:phosphomannomutase